MCNKKRMFIFAQPINQNKINMARNTNYNFDSTASRSGTSSQTPILDYAGRNLTTLAKENKLDPTVGRIDEINRIIQILNRKRKNNPIIIGESGVGKTAIIEGLAHKIAKNDCPHYLIDKQIISLDVNSLVAGTTYRGQFEERLKLLVSEIQSNKDIIIFIDEIHTIIGAGNSSDGLDAANVLKPALARGEIQCIGATTLNEYKETIEKDLALDRRFQKIIINPPTTEETKHILKNIKYTFEEFHNVLYTDDIIDQIVHLSDRYISNRHFPDKAIDVLDEAGARAKLNTTTPQDIIELQDELIEIKNKKLEVVKSQDFETAATLRDSEDKKKNELKSKMNKWQKQKTNNKVMITSDIINDIISSISNVPVKKITTNEITKILDLPNALSKEVVGQTDAIELISSAIKRHTVGIKKYTRPPSFLFVGSSGVGKTQLAKSLASHIFSSCDDILRFDMSEYSEKFDVSKLIGAPPGYIGYNEGGRLTESVKNKPYSIILFDEIEKAHPSIYNILLTIMDEGHITDSFGVKINFKHTIIILTSNVGTSELKNGVKIGFGSENTTQINSKDIINKSLKNTFPPEFLNRIDEIIFFNQLTPNDMLEITKIHVNELLNRLSEIKCVVNIPDNVLEFISIIAFNPEYGAREIQRVIQKHIENPISDLLLQNHLPVTSNINLTLDETNKEIIANITI